MVKTLVLRHDLTLHHVAALEIIMTAEAEEDMIIKEEGEGLIEAMDDVVKGGVAIETKDNRKYKN